MPSCGPAEPTGAEATGAETEAAGAEADGATEAEADGSVGTETDTPQAASRLQATNATNAAAGRTPKG